MSDPGQKFSAAPQPGATRLALHGWACDLPPAAEPAATFGNWRAGQVLLAIDRRPLVGVSWERTAMPPDETKTLLKIARRLRAEHGIPVGGQSDDLTRHAGGIVAIAVPTRAGIFHASLRRCEGAGVTLIARDLAPDAVDHTGFLSHAAAWPVDAPWPWRIYGLDEVLPPWWRLESIEHVAGLVRALFFRFPPGRWRPGVQGRRERAVLVLRRWALAARLLAGQAPVDWLAGAIRRDETIEAVRELAAAGAVAGAIEATVRGPGATLWRRLRRQRDVRLFRLSLQADIDRLTVAEFKGEGEAPWAEPAQRT